MSELGLPIFSKDDYPFLDFNVNDSCSFYDKFKKDFISFPKNAMLNPLKVLIHSSYDNNSNDIQIIISKKKNIKKSKVHLLDKYSFSSLCSLLYELNQQHKTKFFLSIIKNKCENYKKITTGNYQELDVLWSSSSIDKFYINLFKQNSSFFKDNSFQIHAEDYFFNTILIKQDDYLPIIINNDFYFLSFSKITKKIKEIWLQIISIIDEYISITNKSTDSYYKELFLNSSISSCIIEDKNKLISFNNAFVQLNIDNEVLYNLGNKNTLKINDSIYEIKRSPFQFNSLNYEGIFFILKKGLDGHLINKSNEMGIITSSIAHELKNPIAGISGALDLLKLELEDEHICLNVSKDSKESLESLESIYEMKKNIKRCQKLVDLFLGFSRTSSIGLKRGSIKEALEESLTLLRCRLVELDYKTKFKFIGASSSFSIHLASMTMFFYLLFNEVITFLNHSQVIDNNKENKKEISCIFRFDNQFLSIEFLNFSQINQLINNASLIKFVANYEGIIFSIEENTMILKEWCLETK